MFVDSRAVSQRLQAAVEAAVSGQTVHFWLDETDETTVIAWRTLRSRKQVIIGGIGKATPEALRNVQAEFGRLVAARKAKFSERRNVKWTNFGIVPTPAGEDAEAPRQ